MTTDVFNSRYIKIRRSWPLRTYMVLFHSRHVMNEGARVKAPNFGDVSNHLRTARSRQAGEDCLSRPTAMMLTKSKSKPFLELRLHVRMQTSLPSVKFAKVDPSFNLAHINSHVLKLRGGPPAHCRRDTSTPLRRPNKYDNQSVHVPPSIFWTTQSSPCSSCTICQSFHKTPSTKAEACTPREFTWKPSQENLTRHPRVIYLEKNTLLNTINMASHAFVITTPSFITVA